MDTTQTTNQNTSQVIDAHPAVREFDNEKCFIARTGARKGADNRYEIIWVIPETDEESTSRYGKPLSFLIKKGVQEISHGPTYNTLFDGKDQYSEALHNKLQAMADDYKPGDRKVGANATIKAEAAAGREAKKITEELGFSTPEEMVAFIKRAQAKQIK